MVNIRSGLKLVTFDFESCFHTFSIQAVYFEWLDLSAWEHPTSPKVHYSEGLLVQVRVRVGG